MEGCREREGENVLGEIRVLHRATHQMWPRPYRISCNEILYIILNRFSGNTILLSVL